MRSVSIAFWVFNFTNFLFKTRPQAKKYKKREKATNVIECQILLWIKSKLLIKILLADRWCHYLPTLPSKILTFCCDKLKLQKDPVEVIKFQNFV